MKTKLLELGLSEILVDQILDAFDTYLRTIERYDKTKGAISLRDDLKEIESLSKKLFKKLKSLSVFERQLINQSGVPAMFKPRDLFNFTTQLLILSETCANAQKKKIRFSRREPFLLSLTVDLWKLLESHGIPVRKYKNNVLCLVLNTLLPESEKPRKHKKDDSEVPDDLWAFHLLREASKRIKKGGCESIRPNCAG